MFYSKDFEERMNFWNGLVPLRPMVAGLGGHVFGSWAHSGDGQLSAAFRGLRYGRVVERVQEAALVRNVQAEQVLLSIVADRVSVANAQSYSAGRLLASQGRE